jgi:hypothetical protein
MPKDEIAAPYRHSHMATINVSGAGFSEAVADLSPAREAVKFRRL